MLRQHNQIHLLQCFTFKSFQFSLLSPTLITNKSSEIMYVLEISAKIIRDTSENEEPFWILNFNFENSKSKTKIKKDMYSNEISIHNVNRL